MTDFNNDDPEAFTEYIREHNATQTSEGRLSKLLRPVIKEGP